MSFPYIIAPFVAWIAAQGLKFAHAQGARRNLGLHKHLYLSGGMPSAHASVVVALATVVGLQEGVESVAFSITLFFALIVIYDATNVRYSVGEQGKVIKELLAHDRELAKRVKMPSLVLGHTFAEAVAGSVLGLAVGALTLLAF